MTKKRIVVLHPSLVMGGSEKVLINMLNSLDYNRVEVTLWLLNSGGILEKDLPSNVKIKYFDYDKNLSDVSWSRQIKINLKQHQFVLALRLTFYLLLYTISKKPERKFYFTHKKDGIFDKTHYDLLINYNGFRMNLLYWGITGFRAKKRAVWLHGEYNYHALRPYAYEKYDRIFTVSNAVRDGFLDLHPKFEKKTEVFYNIHDIDGIISKSKETCDCEIIHPAIVTVGRVDPEKGIDRVPECMEKLCQAGYSVHWYIVGNGSEKEKIETECKHRGLFENIHFLGEKQNPYPYMKNADVYVQPSRNEGFCQTVFEAKVLKKPIVVTNMPVMREQFENGKNAIITKDQTPAEIAKAIESLLDSPELCNKFINNIAADYPDNDKNIKKLYDLLK